MFDGGEKELTIFIPVANGRGTGGGTTFPRVVNGDGIKREKGKGREDQRNGEREAKAYPAVLHATANSRGDCNVRRFADFDGARIRRCEAASNVSPRRESEREDRERSRLRPRYCETFINSHVNAPDTRFVSLSVPRCIDRLLN